MHPYVLTESQSRTNQEVSIPSSMPLIMFLDNCFGNSWIEKHSNGRVAFNMVHQNPVDRHPPELLILDSVKVTFEPVSK